MRFGSLSLPLRAPARLAIAAAILIVSAACGVKGPPLPPVSTTPQQSDIDASPTPSPTPSAAAPQARATKRPQPKPTDDGDDNP